MRWKTWGVDWGKVWKIGYGLFQNRATPSLVGFSTFSSMCEMNYEKMEPAERPLARDYQCQVLALQGKPTSQADTLYIVLSL